MNPIFKNMIPQRMPNMLGGISGNNPMMNMMNVIQKIQQARQNPNGLADLLLDNGKIDKKTYEQIKDYNPQQLGQYLMQTGAMQQQQVQEAYNNAVPQIQNAMNNRQ